MTQERSFYSFLEKSLVPPCGSQDANVSHYDSMDLSVGEALQDPSKLKAL